MRHRPRRTAAPRHGSPEFLQRHLGNHRFQQITATGGPVVQRKCACGGTCAHCSDKEDEASRIQTKLTVGPPGDRYEREADRVADQVMRMPEPASPAHQEASPNVQRLPAGASSHGGKTNMTLPTAGGYPLSAGMRAFMEPRFGADFSSVRLHTGPPAEQTAARLQARAFTYGRGIWLGRGATEGDRRLMAHELTHVVQQRGGSTAESAFSTTPVSTVQRLPFGIELPSGVRPLDPKEEKIGRGVYGSSLNYGDIHISDALGGGGRPFTLYVPFVGTVIQLGPGPYGSPGSNPGLLIHEMAHSWQSQHHANPAAYIANSIASQAGASAAGASAYCYVPGKSFSEYAAEQLAEQSEDGVAAIRSHMRSIAAGAIDPDLSLLEPRWEVRGAPGVRC